MKAQAPYSSRATVMGVSLAPIVQSRSSKLLTLRDSRRDL